VNAPAHEHAELAEQLRSIDTALRDFHLRTAHREAVIDRLHAENERLRAGLRRGILDPVVTDLARLHDGLLDQAARLAGEPVAAVFASFAEEVELALDRCGVEVVAVAGGEPYQLDLHTATELVPCDDPAQHNTIDAVVTPALRDRETGRVRRPARVRVRQCQARAHEDRGDR
jgi:hypothetical protein